MTVAAQDQVHPVSFQDGHEILPHFQQLDFRVGVVAPLGIRRMMPERDQPGIRVGLEVCLQPESHGAGR